MMGKVLGVLSLLLAIAMANLLYSFYQWGINSYTAQQVGFHIVHAKEDRQRLDDLGDPALIKTNEDRITQFECSHPFYLRLEREWLYKMPFDIAVIVVVFVLIRMEVVRRRNARWQYPDSDQDAREDATFDINEKA
jgi:hypothetical protein